ncbi:MAG TPA: metallophosphoesterase family protein [Acidobacteriota bacterium]|nr:metallophosphoesterase family protein [Acidobacteriota bacterium]
MKAFFVADLHYHKAHPKAHKRELLTQQVSRLCHDLHAYKPDLLTLCGDSAYFEPGFSHHLALLAKIRQTYKGKIAFIVGNHELWGRQFGIPAHQLLTEGYLHFARRNDLHYLEDRNLTVEGVRFAGSYAHYDGSLAPEFNGAVIDCRDKGYINLGLKTNASFSTFMLDELSHRLNARGADALVTHTVPSIALIGREQNTAQQKYNTWAGTSHIQRIVDKHQPFVFFCGHSHANAYQKTPRTTLINIGHSWDEDKTSYHGVDFSDGSITWFRNFD